MEREGLRPTGARGRSGALGDARVAVTRRKGCRGASSEASRLAARSLPRGPSDASGSAAKQAPQVRQRSIGRQRGGRATGRARLSLLRQSVGCVTASSACSGSRRSMARQRDLVIRIRVHRSEVIDSDGEAETTHCSGARRRQAQTLPARRDPIIRNIICFRCGVDCRPHDKDGVLSSRLAPNVLAAVKSWAGSWPQPARRP